MHSPGPWQPYLPGRKFVVSKRNFNTICELNENERPHEVVIANAKLIAAAPDLLDACQLAHKVMSVQGENDLDEWIIVLASLATAIAHATE